MITIKDKHGNTHHIRRDAIAHVVMNENGANVLLDKPFVQRIEVTDVAALLAALGHSVAGKTAGDNDLLPDEIITRHRDSIRAMGSADSDEVRMVVEDFDRRQAVTVYFDPTQARTLAALLIREAAKVEAQQ